MVYFFVLIFWLLIFASNWTTKKDKSIGAKELILLFLPFYIIHAFVDGYSVDDIPNYFDVFEELKTRSFKDIFLRDLSFGASTVEIGWLILNKIISLLTSSTQFLLIVDSFIILYCYASVIKRNSYAAWLSVFIILCTIYPQSLLVLRQHTAMAICMLAIQPIIDRKLIKFISIVILATLFHNTAASFLPLYFLYYLRIDKKFYLTMLVTEGALMFIGTQLLINLMGAGLFTKDYGNYFEDTDRLNNYTGFFIAVAELIFFMFFVRPNKETTGIEKVLYIMMLMSVIFTSLGGVIPIGGRLSKYYSIANIIAMPICVKHSSLKYRTLIVFVIVLLYLTFALVNNQWSKPWLENMRLIFE